MDGYGWLLLSASFTAKLGLIFVLTLENTFSQRFHFKTNRKSIGSSKKTVLGIFKIALRLRDRHVFIWQSVEILSVFNTATLKHIFSKMNFKKKKMKYRFLVESTKIENASCKRKTSISEANVKTNRMMSANGPITKNGVLSVTTLFFWKFCFSLRTSYIELISCTNSPNVHIRTFCKRWSFIWQ